MSIPSPPSPYSDRRVTLTYSVDDLPAHDVLLLKSLIRLLSHRTHQHWLYQPEQVTDLRVRGDAQPHGPAAGATSGETPPVLLLSHIRQTQLHCLGFPLNVNELEHELNQLGQHILQARTLRATATESGSLDAHKYQLLRWPPAALLTSPVRMKMATLLTGRPLSVADLQERSRQPLLVCREFLLALQRAGLLQQLTEHKAGTASDPHTRGPEVVARSKPSAGLLARIRSRLDLQSTTLT